MIRKYQILDWTNIQFSIYRMSLSVKENFYIFCFKCSATYLELNYEKKKG